MCALKNLPPPPYICSKLNPFLRTPLILAAALTALAALFALTASTVWAGSPPKPVENLQIKVSSCKATNCVVKVTWQPPKDGDSPKKYVVRLVRKSNWGWDEVAKRKTVKANKRKATFRNVRASVNLAGEPAWAVQVSSVNRAGKSAWVEKPIWIWYRPPCHADGECIPNPNDGSGWYVISP